jgi:lipoic acid synthetase
MLPPWIRPKFPKRAALERMQPTLRRWGVHTVCENARCPNLGECFSAGTATFMLLGEVVTSVTRDDLDDGGANHFVALIRAVRETCPQTTVEVLVPDFGGDREALGVVCAAGPDILGHNLETVARLFPTVRPGADYDRSLQVLRWAKMDFGAAITKSGLMVGLGETDDEVLQAARDLRSVGVDSLTVGQYLQPTREHLPVSDHVSPERFDAYAAAARAMGFTQVLSAPLVRSSYHAAMPAGASRAGGGSAA